MKIGARYADRLRSRLSRRDEKTRLSVRITESFMMTSRGSLWRIVLPVRLSYLIIGSMASRRRKAPHPNLLPQGEGTALSCNVKYESSLSFFPAGRDARASGSEGSFSAV